MTNFKIERFSDPESQGYLENILTTFFSRGEGEGEGRKIKYNALREAFWNPHRLPIDSAGLIEACRKITDAKLKDEISLVFNELTQRTLSNDLARIEELSKWIAEALATSKRPDWHV